MLSSVVDSKSSEQGLFETKWWKKPWKAMADLAEAVDDFICSFDYMDTAMDNLAMLIFIWILFSIVILAIAKFAYTRFKKPKVIEDKPLDKKPNDASVTEAISKKSVIEIIKSADSVLATSAKVKSSVLVKSRPVTKSNSHVPASPASRKRLSRMSPGPEVVTRRGGTFTVPTCTGPDAMSVKWLNDVLLWLYSDLVIVNELIQLWIQSMNEFSKKSVEEQGIGVELVRALDCHPPTISNVYCECDSKDDVTVTCDCEATPAFQLKAFSQKADKVEVSHYRLNVNRFRARLSIVCITDKLTGILQCDGWPEVKVALAPVGPLRPNAAEHDLQHSISEVVVSALRNTKVEFSLAQYPTCPRLRRHFETPPRQLPLHYDSMMSHIGSSTPHGLGGIVQGDKRLLVKVVAAKDLGGKQGCTAPYCVVEMDEPPQKNQTAVKKDTNSPAWDEHFLFDLSPHTAELLFEVYDRASSATSGRHRFLGLGLVGIDELLVSPSQRQLIGLQGRPMEDEDVTGTLTVEFLFIEGADIPDSGARPFKLKESLRTVSPSGLTTTTTKTTFQQNGPQNPRLTEQALRELETSPSNTANKSTLIIHSVQREPKKSIQLEITESGKFIEVERRKADEIGELESPLDNDLTLTAHESVCDPTKEKNGSNGLQNDKAGDYIDRTKTPESDAPPEAAPRKKRRDFFGTIKRRLGRSKSRAGSEPPQALDNDSRIRSLSAERRNHDAANSSARGALSAGASPAQSGDESRASRRSSLSEVSGFSTASGRTFVHESSTLVLETLEAGLRKHYLVPLAIAARSRWRRKGVKLHLYNEHTFIAKHLSGGTVCEVCNKTVARRIGKQGYECRDCLMRCHKHCHVTVLTTCPRSTLHNMELAMLPVLQE